MSFWSIVSDPVVMFTNRVASETNSGVCFLHYDGQGMLSPPTFAFPLKLRGLYSHGLPVPDHGHTHLHASLGLRASPWTHRVMTLNCLPTFSFTSASSCSLCGSALNLFKAWLLKRTRFSTQAFPVVLYPLLKIQHVPSRGTQKSGT